MLLARVASITDRVLSKEIGKTRDDKMALRRLALVLEKAEVALDVHQNIWKKVAKGKFKFRK